jgi:hypothetical protein
MEFFFSHVLILLGISKNSVPITTFSEVIVPSFTCTQTSSDSYFAIPRLFNCTGWAVPS